MKFFSYDEIIQAAKGRGREIARASGYDIDGNGRGPAHWRNGKAKTVKSIDEL